MDIGLQEGGLTLQQSFEIDTVCCDTMRRNFNDEVVQCDITKEARSDGQGLPPDGGNLSPHEVFTNRRHSWCAHGRRFVSPFFSPRGNAKT